jgi:DNA-binding CsgD family transcriptional regulator
VLSPAAARRLIVASADRQPARDRARHLAGSLTDREAQVLACLGEGLSNAQIAARLYLSEARVKGYVSRMLDKLGCANRAQAGLLAHDAPVSSARSPGRRSCRLELGLGARQAGLRPSPGRSCPPGAAGLTGPPRHDPVLGSSGRSVMHTSRRRETGRPRAAQFAPRAVYVPGGSATWCRKEGAQDGDSRSALAGAGRGRRGVPGADRAAPAGAAGALGSPGFTPAGRCGVPLDYGTFFP